MSRNGRRAIRGWPGSTVSPEHIRGWPRTALFNPVHNIPKNLTTASTPSTTVPLPDTIQMSAALRKRTECPAGHQRRHRHSVPPRLLHRAPMMVPSRSSSRESHLFALESRRVWRSLRGISGEGWEISLGCCGSCACKSSALPVKRLHRSIREDASPCLSHHAFWNHQRPEARCRSPAGRHSVTY